MKTQIISADDLDFDRHVTAFREAFAHVGWREEIEPATSAEFFRWKYSTPYGDAVIAHIAAGGRLISSASAFPLMLRTPAGTHLAWQVGDLITTPDARGQGPCKNGGDERCCRSSSDVREPGRRPAKQRLGYVRHCRRLPTEWARGRL